MDPNELLNNRYRIRSELGRGGFGAVYLADDTRFSRRQVALKENLITTLEAQQQFEREAELLALLHHPNLPQVTDYFSDPSGKQYLVMDYIAGDNLRQLLTRQAGLLPVDEALAIVEQVMQAVAYMHTWRDPESGQIRPIIHRDIKPDNIKRTPEGRIVLVDFGIAKVQLDTATAVSARALTPGYAPIEQYHGGTDERSDVYSLGATLYVLLTGRVPPSATSMAAGAPLPSLRTFNQNIPPVCVKVIEKALALKAVNRYQSIAEMYQALYDRPLHPIVAVAATPSLQPSARPHRIRGAPVGWVASALAVLALVLLLWQMQRAAPALQIAESVATESSAVVAAVQPGTPTPPARAESSTADLTVTESESSTTGVNVTAASTGEATATADVETPISTQATGINPPESASAIVAHAVASATHATSQDDQATRVIAPTSTRVPTATPALTATKLPTATPTPLPAMSPDEAIVKYFSLIQEAIDSTGADKIANYMIAFEMLSDEYKRTRNNDDFENYWSGWEDRIGRPTILSPAPAADYMDTDNAAVTIYLRFEKDRRSCIKIIYILTRDVRAGNQEFGYWLLYDAEGQMAC